MRLVPSVAALILLPWGLHAATITHDFAFQGPIERRNVSVFDRSPGDGMPFSRRSEVALAPVPFTLPRFDPSIGTLTDVEVVYRLGDVGLPGQNSVVGATDTECGAPNTCEKTLAIAAAFTYGLAIEGVAGSSVQNAGFAFDLALVSAIAEGDSVSGLGQALALSGFESGDAATRSFSEGQARAFLGTGDLAFNAFNTAAAVLTLNCLPDPGPVTTCSETAAVFMLPDFEVELTYEYTPVPLPAGAPLLLAGLAGLALLRRRQEP